MSKIEDIAQPWVRDLKVYEPGKPIEEVARELGLADAAEIVKLASNENALGPSPLAVAAMHEAAASMHRYPDGDAFYLRTALSKKLGVAPEQLLIGNGSNELIELLAHVFLGPGTELLMADRAFMVYRLVAHSFRAGLVTVPMRELTHDLDAMLNAITPRTRLVFIANPNNPTGTMVSGAQLDTFLAKVPQHVVTVLDEAYIELLSPDEQPDTLKYVRNGSGRVVVLRTFSKTYGLAGLRVGYAVAVPEMVALLNRVRQPFNVNAMALAAAVAALDDEDYVRNTRALVSDGRAFLETSFRRMGLRVVPSVTNFMLVEVGNGRQFFDRLQRLEVIVRPMDVYALPGYVRVTVGTESENRKCVAAFESALK